MMGQLAALDDYDPNATFPPRFTDAADAAAYRLGRSVRRPSETSQATIDKLAGVASDVLIPKTPLDLAMTVALGPGLGRAARVGALALGAMFESSEAKAGKLDIARRALREVPLGGIAEPARAPSISVVPGARAAQPGALFDYSRLGDVPDVPQSVLQRYAPPRGVPDAVADLVKNKRVERQMLELMEGGKQIGADQFYNNEPLRQAFIAELGNKRGPLAFADYMDFVAATSPRSKVPENARNASYYYVLDRQGQPMPAVGDKNPSPYGHMAQRLHQQNAQTVAEGGWDLMKNPKPPSFSQNLQGNFAPVTVDAHAFKAPAMLSRDPRFLAQAIKLDKDTPTINPSTMFASGDLTMKEALQRPVYWRSAPEKTEYGALEAYYQNLAREVGLAPAQAQAAGWAGGGELTGLGSVAGEPFLRAVENRANITADARGVSPQEALSRFIRGREPLLTVPPAAALGALAAQDQYAPQ